MNQASKGFHIARIISYAKALVNMAIVVAFLYQMIPALNFTNKPCILAVHGGKMILRQRAVLTNLQLSQTISFN